MHRRLMQQIHRTNERSNPGLLVRFEPGPFYWCCRPPQSRLLSQAFLRQWAGGRIELTDTRIFSLPQRVLNLSPFWIISTNKGVFERRKTSMAMSYADEGA
jgi:hypothetical protein